MKKLVLLIAIGLIAPICEGAPKSLDQILIDQKPQNQKQPEKPAKNAAFAKQNNAPKAQNTSNSNTLQKRATWKQKISEKFSQAKDFGKKNSKKIILTILFSTGILRILTPFITRNLHEKIDRQLAHQQAETGREANGQPWPQREMPRIQAEHQARMAHAYTTFSNDLTINCCNIIDQLIFGILIIYALDKLD